MLILYLIWKTGSFFCAPTCWTQVTCTQLLITAKHPRLHHAAGKVGHLMVLSFVSHLFPVNTHKTCFLNSIQNQQDVLNQDPYF